MADVATDVQVRLRAQAALLVRFSPARQDEAADRMLRLLGALADGYQQAQELAWLAQQLPAAHRLRAIEATLTAIGDVGNANLRASALKTLVPYLVR